MTAISNLPVNRNFLSPLGFSFTIKKTPSVNYFVQSVSIPNVSLGQSDIQTPFNRLPIPGDHVNYEPFTVTFRVDEEMRNYQELFDWIVFVGFPDNFDQYNTVATQRARFGGSVTNPVAGTGIYSDASLMVLNSAKAPILEIVYKDMYPIDLSTLDFDARSTDVDYIECTVSFAYRSFTLNRL